jgi:hypothetical protein
MAIATDFGRLATQVGYHRITSADTATDLTDWLDVGNFAPGPDGFVIDNEDGTFDIWDAASAVDYVTASVGDYVLFATGTTLSPSDFAKQYVVPASVLGA